MFDKVDQYPVKTIYTLDDIFCDENKVIEFLDNKIKNNVYPMWMFSVCSTLHSVKLNVGDAFEEHKIILDFTIKNKSYNFLLKSNVCDDMLLFDKIYITDRVQFFSVLSVYKKFDSDYYVFECLDSVRRHICPSYKGEFSPKIK